MSTLDDATVVDEDELGDDDTTLLTGDNRVMSVSKLSEAFNVRPQIVNAWVKLGCPVVQEKPRMLDMDQVLEWKEGHDKAKSSTPRQPKEKKQKLNPDGSLGGLDEEPTDGRILNKLQLTPNDRKLLAWNRGEGRGWALAKPLDMDQPVVDDYIRLVNHADKIHSAAGSSLLEEAKRGKLFVIDVDLGLAFLTGQVEGVINTVTQPHDDLVKARDHMKEALNCLLSWKQAQTVA